MKKLFSFFAILCSLSLAAQDISNTLIISPDQLDSVMIDGKKYYKLKFPVSSEQVKTLSDSSAAHTAAIISLRAQLAGIVIPPSSPTSITVRTATGSSDKLTATDKGNVVDFTSNFSNNIICTLPASLPSGEYTIVQRGSGSVKVVSETGLTLFSRKSQYRSATVNSVVKIMVRTDRTAIIFLDTKY